MAKKTKRVEVVEEVVAPITVQPITETLEKNYMPYAMSVIISRAIPEIDGFKPAHRKLLYTMYKMGLLTGARTKSANIVGQTMRLNPHGDASIYETMVRLTRGNEALLHPFVDSKGSFGKQYSSDMAFAAPRYTEAKLDSFCAELFRGIDKDSVDFVPNYDNTMQEPTLLPTSFPNILLSPNTGIAVGMASNICSFNLNELCDGTIQLLKNPQTNIERILDIIKAPDLPSGGMLIYDRDQLRGIYETGRGKFKLRARYSYDKDANCIDVYQIPYTTTIEAIMKKMIEMAKAGKLKEVADFRDEIDKNGFKFTIDLKRGVNPDTLMNKLYHATPLESDFPCNFNVLIDGTPHQLGVVALLNEWIRFRIGCVKRELTFDRARKQEKLHLLVGLGQIFLDIDKAIRIIRETKKEEEVVPNLMTGFGIDQVQAEYISEIKLRNLNEEYILNRIKEIESLQAEIQRLGNIIDNPTEIRAYIAEQLKEIKKKYGKPRMTQLSYEPIAVYKEEEHIENYRSMIFLTREGYFKKIKLTSLRGNDEQRFKDGDKMRFAEEAQNSDFILFFTDKAQVYRAKMADFDCVKSSDLGLYIPSELGFEENEHVIAMKSLCEFVEGHEFLFAFENGKCVRIPANSYDTKSNRKKLTKAFSDASPAVGVIYLDGNVKKIYLISDQNRALTLGIDRVIAMNTRTARGSTIFQLKGKGKLVDAGTDFTRFVDAQKYWKTKFPASGVVMAAQDIFSE
jgi:DNA gyrase subunit A